MRRSALFQVFKLSKPNGRKWWKVEGRPTGKRVKHYFVTEKEAKQAAADLGRRRRLHKDSRTLREESVRRRPLLSGPSRPAGFLGIGKGTLRTGKKRIPAPDRRR